MIVVGADHDGLARARRIGAGQDSHDVRRPDLVRGHLDSNLDARARRERRRRPRRDQILHGRGRGSAGRRQQDVGRRARERSRHEAYPGRGRRGRRHAVAGDQQRGRAVPLRGDQLVEAAHACSAEVRRRPFQRERDLSADVDGRVVVVPGVRKVRAVADEDDVAAGLAGQRPTVRGPLAAGLEAPRRRRGELEAARRRRARRGLEDERLEIRSRVAAGPKARGREPVGDLTRGAIAAGGARAAALHFRSRQRLHVGAEPRGVGRDDGGARESAHGGDQQRREQQEGDNQAASHTHILLQLWWGVPSPAREES